MNLFHNADMRRIPPFDALVAFDAVARTGSVTRAAEEIGVTQSAVSHRLRRLEQFMQIPLYERRSDGLHLNVAGQTLRADVSDLLERAAELRLRCTAAEAPNRLRIGLGSALADNWLIGRLPDFARKHPDIAVEVSIVENGVERDMKVDARIKWVSASAAKPNSTQLPLFREHVFPVCAPHLLEGLELNDPRVLQILPLIHKRTPEGQGAEWEWSAWFERLELAGRPQEGIRVTSIGPAVAAALVGAGVALTRTMLVCDALAVGRLCRVLPPEFDQLSSKVHVLQWSTRHLGSEQVRAFATWLVDATRLSSGEEPWENSLSRD
jgi:LysR family transcriptional regulator, glycine cleavage system transcriptional activator